MELEEKSKSEQKLQKLEKPTEKEKLVRQFQEIDCTLLSKPANDLETKLLNQLEFYLGDSNLGNDKFLFSLLKQSDKGYIDINTFLNFNKIKNIVIDIPDHTQKLKTLINALEKSTLLKLNKEKTKVRRKIPFVCDESFKQRVDDATVYVENFPENMTHDQLASIFSNIGKILYISLPTFSKTKTAKGFAFIQFSVIFLFFKITLKTTVY